jgi:uroporphyrin-III C-methyltransferase
VTGFAALDRLDFPAFEPGTVWLVGAGPGAPGLLSLLAYHGLQQAEVIVHDALVGEAVLALANPAAEIVYAGKRGGKPSESQADITARLIGWAEAGRRVLRLKGGDPFVFGRGAEEALALAARGIGFRIVPGISAGIGGLAYAGIPLTWRNANQAVVFVTGHDAAGDVPQAVDWAAIARAAPVIVIYMGVRHLQAIADRLIAAGRAPDERVAVVSQASLAGQATLEGTLGGAASLVSGSPSPAIVVVGPVGAIRAELDWFVGPLRENGIG